MNLNQSPNPLTPAARKFKRKMTEDRTHLSLRRVRESLNRLRQIPIWIRHTVVIWIAADAVTYSAVFVNWACPVWANKEVDLFLCPGYHYTLYSTWYVKFLSEQISRLLYYYAGCKIAVKLSDYLFMVSVILFGFRIIDFLNFLWNFCHYDLLYIDIFWTMLTLIWTVFKGYKPETVAKVKSLF